MIVLGTILFLLDFKLIKFNDFIKGQRHKGSIYHYSAMWESWKISAIMNTGKRPLTTLHYLI